MAHPEDLPHLRVCLTQAMHLKNKKKDMPGWEGIAKNADVDEDGEVLYSKDYFLVPAPLLECLLFIIHRF